MVEPELPFACGMPNCGMTFTNEDHLHVHTKKHDMVLQLGMEQKSAFVADQTPTPTRFIRNCEEVGLFQELLNPFDEGFKRAMETKAGIQSLEAAAAGVSSDDVLHTPQMVFPLTDGDSALYTSNNQRNITISRSSSDESGAVKEYETTTISKLTNEVTTISRIVNKPDVLEKIDDVSILRHEDVNKEINETVSYTNNVIKIQSNVEIRKDASVIETSKHIPRTLITYTDSVVKDAQVTKELTDKEPRQEKVPPIMSQKSLDHVVDSLSLDEHSEKKDGPLVKVLKRNYQNAIKKPEAKRKELIELDEFEIIIKKPDGRQVRMKPVEDDKRIQDDTKERLKRVLSDKAEKKLQENSIRIIPEAQLLQNVVPITTGTLVPVTIVNPNTILLANNLQKIPIVPFNVNKVTGDHKNTVKRRISDANTEVNDDDCIIVDVKNDVMDKKKLLESRTAASRRYRQKQKVTMHIQAEENRVLKETNKKLLAENSVLKQMIKEHLKSCTNPGNLKITDPQANS